MGFFGKTVGLFDVGEPKKGKATGFGRQVTSKRDIPAIIKAVKKVISGLYLKSPYVAMTPSSLAGLLSFAQAVGLVANESEVDSIMAEMTNFAGGAVSKPVSKGGALIFTKFDELATYFLAPVAKSIIRGGRNVQAGRVRDFVSAVSGFVQNVGRGKKGFNKWDWAILAVGTSEAARITPEASSQAGIYASYPALAQGFVNFAATGMTTASSLRTVKSRLQLNFVSIGKLAEKLKAHVGSYASQIKRASGTEKRRLLNEQKNFLNAVGRVVAEAAEKGAGAIADSLSIVLIKNNKLKSAVGDAYLVKSIVKFFGGSSNFAGANLFDYGLKTKAGTAIVRGSSVEAVVPAGTNLVKLSARSMAGRILVYGLIKHMINYMNSNPNELYNISGRSSVEVAPALNALLTGANVSSKREFVQSFKRLTKGLVFYMRLDKGGFGAAVNAAASNPNVGLGAYKAISKMLGISRVSGGPMRKITAAEILGGTVSGFKGNEVSGCGLFGDTGSAEDTTGLFGEQPTAKGAFGRKRKF